ncbi:MAG TPA: ATP-binding protein [Ktedonobacteraceae bacterium]|nr:ATP-binding protein [Ktedonobacteraceae bacterium]
MPSYLTTSDVATRLGVSLDTVRRWLRSGELKGTPFGRAGYRIEDADFEAFLHHRRRQPQELAVTPAEQYALSSEALAELMNAMGQELRVPLATTRGTVQQARRLLQRILELSLSENAIDQLTKLQDLLLRADRQIGAEIRLAGNLLDAWRIEANTFELSPVWCNLVEIVRETVSSLQELAAQGLFEQELPVDDLVAIIADADHIRQVLTNYLMNALKFSPIGQPIKIYLVVNDAQARVSVQDKGPGISDSQQSSIWERFGQGQKQSIGSGSGLGLGLFITRAIIQKHGGQVGVESRVGEGSTFWFTLPLADET